ncbi:hypothetical protein FA95DRAFT_1565661 [Auriscalpium vulgare]|uniref:Uncharacterized protein n=1 Tax=Auriscalpium vulgare TaxID=40419 RepID=A0ACB8RAW4_9AGAM|nr:hypothetical protein FA95DRAFT_1565661 [Auriscalpium vulgare]
MSRSQSTLEPSTSLVEVHRIFHDFFDFPDLDATLSAADFWLHCTVVMRELNTSELKFPVNNDVAIATNVLRALMPRTSHDDQLNDTYTLNELAGFATERPNIDSSSHEPSQISELEFRRELDFRHLSSKINGVIQDILRLDSRQQHENAERAAEIDEGRVEHSKLVRNVEKIEANHIFDMGFFTELVETDSDRYCQNRTSRRPPEGSELPLLGGGASPSASAEPQESPLSPFPSSARITPSQPNAFYAPPPAAQSPEWRAISPMPSSPAPSVQRRMEDRGSLALDNTSSMSSTRELSSMPFSPTLSPERGRERRGSLASDRSLASDDVPSTSTSPNFSVTPEVQCRDERDVSPNRPPFPRLSLQSPPKNSLALESPVERDDFPDFQDQQVSKRAGSPSAVVYGQGGESPPVTPQVLNSELYQMSGESLEHDPTDRESQEVSSNHGRNDVSLPLVSPELMSPSPSKSIAIAVSYNVHLLHNNGRSEAIVSGAFCIWCAIRSICDTVIVLLLSAYLCNVCWVLVEVYGIDHDHEYYA